MPDADPVTCGIKEVEQVSKSEDMQRVVVDTVSRMQVERMVRAMDAASNVGACVLVKPAGHPIPPLHNMIVMEPSITLPCDPMTSASHADGSRYSGGSWEVIILIDKHVPLLLEKSEGGGGSDVNEKETTVLPVHHVFVTEFLPVAKSL